MQFEIMSRSKAIRYSYKNHKEKSIIISISDTWDIYPKFYKKKENNIIAICCLFFDDIQSKAEENMIAWKKENGETTSFVIQENCYSLMSKEQADKITDFVIKYKDKVDKIIVHCFAGVSRSAGVCAAIMEYFKENSNIVFSNQQYTPNMYCYRIVKESFYKKEGINGK